MCIIAYSLHVMLEEEAEADPLDEEAVQDEVHLGPDLLATTTSTTTTTAAAATTTISTTIITTMIYYYYYYY